MLNWLDLSGYIVGCRRFGGDDLSWAVGMTSVRQLQYCGWSVITNSCLGSWWAAILLLLGFQPEETPLPSLPLCFPVIGILLGGGGFFYQKLVWIGSRLFLDGSTWGLLLWVAVAIRSFVVAGVCYPAWR